MGCFKKASACSAPVYPTAIHAASTPVVEPKNPDQAHFVIEHYEGVGRFLVVCVRYPDCTNYEGRKTLVYENLDETALRSATHLDPHFCDHAGHVSPVARFAPTTKGWKYAIAFCVFVTASDRLRR